MAELRLRHEFGAVKQCDIPNDEAVAEAKAHLAIVTAMLFTPILDAH
jgi:hypothetical protein